MEKLGVAENEERTKSAEEGSRCPGCGGRLRPREETGVFVCACCGTKPFEGEDGEA